MGHAFEFAILGPITINPGTWGDADAIPAAALPVSDVATSQQVVNRKRELHKGILMARWVGVALPQSSRANV